METNLDQNGCCQTDGTENPYGSDSRQKSSMPTVALVLAIIGLIISPFPLIGLILAAIAVIISVLAFSKASRGIGKKNIAAAAIVVSVIAEIVSLIITSCTGAVVYKFIQETERQGTSLNEIFEKYKNESAKLNGKGAEDRRRMLSNSIKTFSKNFQAKTGKHLSLDETQLDEILSGSDENQIAKLQQLLSIETENMDPETMELLSNLIFMNLKDEGEGLADPRITQQVLNMLSDMAAADEAAANDPNDSGTADQSTITITEAAQDPSESAE